MELQETRDRVLLAALAHVAVDGWTERSLRAGAADAGLAPEAGVRAFPAGMLAAVEHFSDYADRRMLSELAALDLGAMRVRDRVATAVELRLEALAPHREAVRRALSYLALTRNAGAAARCLYRTVDAIWYAAGDEATDFSFYTKRALLAGVYAATVLYWLGDTSEGVAATRGFLERRISGAFRVSGLPDRVARGLSGLLRRRHLRGRRRRSGEKSCP